jgi:hypothetical protein
MPEASAGSLEHPRVVGAAGLMAVLLLLVGVPVQAAFTARSAHTALTARHAHAIRDLLVAAGDRIPDGARYAVTSFERAPNAVYMLPMATAVDVDLAGPAAVVHERLRHTGVGFVIVLYRDRPQAFAPPDPRWYRVVTSLRAGQVLQLVHG